MMRKPPRFLELARRHLSSSPRVSRRNGEAKDAEVLLSLLEALVATRWVHQIAHWQSSGPTYYGDHLLFQRLYEKVDEEVDDVAEKAVALSRGVTVDATRILSNAAECVTRSSTEVPPTRSSEDLAARSWSAENAVLRSVRMVRSRLESAGSLSLGIDNMLAQIADTHEKHLYLLGQRLNAGM